MSKIRFLPAYQFNELLRQMALQKMPRCEQKVASDCRGRNAKLGNKCRNFAKIELDGKKMCIRHAQSYALAKMIKARK